MIHDWLKDEYQRLMDSLSQSEIPFKGICTNGSPHWSFRFPGCSEKWVKMNPSQRVFSLVVSF
jgi:hypothetical protein